MTYALVLTRRPAGLRPGDLRPLRDAGLADEAIHDAAAVAAYFNFVNRVALGLGVEPEPDDARGLGDAVRDAEALLRGPEPELRVPARCAEHLSASASVDAGAVEVAVLRLIDGAEFVFAHPPALVGGNRLPVRGSLAGRILESDGGLIDNAVVSRPRFSLYERIASGSEKPAPIQKLLGVAIPGARGALGVIEVSRRGASAAAAGPDFRLVDLERLREAAAAFAPLLERAWRDPA